MTKRNRFLSADDAICALNARRLETTTPDAGGRSFMRVHWAPVRPDGSRWALAEISHPSRRLGCPPRREYALQSPNGSQRLYGANYARAVRHFEFVTRD
jgi:hypothetical protein